MNKLPREIVGTTAFPSPIAIAARIFQAEGFRVDIDEVKHPSGRVLVFSIPSRLKGTAYHLEGKYLMRSGESLVPMSEDQMPQNEAVQDSLRTEIKLVPEIVIRELVANAMIHQDF